MGVRKKPREWKNKDGTASKAWVVDYTDNSGKRRNIQFDHKHEAQQAWAKIQVDLGKNIHIPARQTATVKECTELWYAHCEARGIERTTLESYKRYKESIDAELGAIKVTQLTTAAVLAFRDKIARAEKERGNTGDGADRLVLYLGAILQAAMKRGKVAQNVVRLLDKDDKSRDRHKPKLEVGVDIPTVAEIHRLIAQLDDSHFVQWRALFLTLIFTGLRCSEVRGLPWNYVDLDDKFELRVRQRADAYKKIGSPKTKGSSRTVPLLPTLVTTLLEHKLQTPKTAHNLVFPTKRGDVLDDLRIQNALNEVQIAARIVDAEGWGKYSPHKLRHFYASLCINAKTDGGLEWPIKKVSERLGHSSIRMTADRYGHLFPRGDDAAELATADAMFFDNVSPPRPATATVTALRPHAQEVPVALPQPQAKSSPVVVVAESERAPDAEPTSATVAAVERAKTAILADPAISTRELVSKTGASPLEIRRVRAALRSQLDDAAVLVGGRSTRGQFLPGPRERPRMDRAKAAVLANPTMPARALAKEIGVSRSLIDQARQKALNPNGENPVSTENRSTLGRFMPGPRHTAAMARVEAAVLANPSMSAQALANQIGVGKTSVKRARKRLQSKLGANPVSGGGE